MESSSIRVFEYSNFCVNDLDNEGIDRDVEISTIHNIESIPYRKKKDEKLER